MLLVDDEKTVRDGLKVIIDWQSYGFDSILEGEDGSDGLAKMRDFNPELTLLDIRMPKLSGLEAAEQARKAGYEGKIIMLSGYSDFQYAQSAIRFGVDAYLLKSIDEEELAAAVQKVREDIQRKAETSLIETQNAKLARNSLLCDVLLGRTQGGEELASQHVLSKSGVYRVALVCLFDADERARRLAENILRSCFSQTELETVSLDGKLVMILKAAEAVPRLSNAVKAARKRAGIPVFAGMGRAVDSFGEISLSYEDARQSVEDKFYCRAGDIVCFEGGSCPKGDNSVLDPQNYLDKILTYAEAGEPEKIKSVLCDLKQRIMAERLEPDKAKGTLSSLYVGLLGRLQLSRFNKPCELPTDSEIVDKVFDMDYLDEIISYLGDEFCRISSGIAGANRDIAAKVLGYVEKNSNRDLKLESIAELFGYNSTYLGKIFKKANGESFNAYLDRLRIENAETLLSKKGLKVYEICELVGYRNLNYFYKKFKRFVGISPSEYRNNLQMK